MNRNDSEKYIISRKEFRDLSSEEKIMKLTEGFDTPSGKPEKEVLDAIFKNAEEKRPAKIVSLSRYFQAVAAVVLLLVGIYTVTTVFSKNRVRTKFTEQTDIQLPDGTNVILNADSKMVWKDKNFAKTRQLKLKGEAYFDVEKGGSFVIETPNGKVEILGTKLNIFSRENNFRVSCIEGKVKVTSAGNEQILTPGEMAEVTGSKLLKISKNNIEQTISWQHGIFYFEDKPLVSIFAALERQFDVSVHFEGNKDRSITVAFSNKSLHEALDVICIPMGLKYEINKKTVNISEKPE